MSHLADHARAARIMSDAFERKYRAHTYDKAASVMLAMAEVYRSAAATMEAEVKKDAASFPAGCTIDHKTMGSPTCGACGARRG